MDLPIPYDLLLQNMQLVSKAKGLSGIPSWPTQPAPLQAGASTTGGSRLEENTSDAISGQHRGFFGRR